MNGLKWKVFNFAGNALLKLPNKTRHDISDFCMSLALWMDPGCTLKRLVVVNMQTRAEEFVKELQRAAVPDPEQN